MKDYHKIEMGTNFKCEIELPGEHTVDLLICGNTFYVKRNQVKLLPFWIIKIPYTLPQGKVLPRFRHVKYRNDMTKMIESDIDSRYMKAR